MSCSPPDRDSRTALTSTIVTARAEANPTSTENPPRTSDGRYGDPSRKW
jgi:hypothetical protein